MQIAISTNELRKTYDNGTQAVQGITLKIPAGMIYGFLGPNGAGKSTTISMLVNHLRPTDGTITMMGLDLETSYNELNRMIGYVPQSLVFYEKLTVDENLSLFADLFEIKKKSSSMAWVKSLLLLEEVKSSRAENLSGGQKRRLNVAIGLLGAPQILFLDEPSAGMDPQSRAVLWDTLKKLVKSGMTIVLTTHLMEVAERICSRVAIIDHGKILAEGTVEELKKMVNGEERAILKFSREYEIADELFEIYSKAFTQVQRYDHTLAITLTHGVQEITNIMDILPSDLKVQVTDLTIRGASLEDVFITLTGKGLRE